MKFLSGSFSTTVLAEIQTKIMLRYDYVLLLALCTACLNIHGSLGEERCFFDGKEVPQNTDLTDLPKRPLHWHRLACLTLNPRTLTLVKVRRQSIHLLGILTFFFLNLHLLESRNHVHNQHNIVESF